VDVEEDAELCADNDKDDDAGGCEEDDVENDEGEDFESPANTTAATNNNDNKDNRGSRTKRPPSILTSKYPTRLNPIQRIRNAGRAFSESNPGCYDDPVHNTPQ
jgi:hypothetical protein